jgi:acyl-CoA hydrolase/RimJ/RimL family protein N-acetyltransferase
MREMSSLRALEKKLTNPEEAVSVIRPGARVYVGTACATPRVLTRALEDSPNPPSDVQFLHFLTSGAIPDRGGGLTTLFQHRCFFVGSDMRELVKQGKAQYVPISIAQVLWLIDNGRIVVDAALIQVSMPDEHGYVSLGVSVDITHAMLRKARAIIAEINPHMPFTLGDSFVHLDEIDSCVLVDAPVIEFVHEPADEVARQIARYVARTIEDGATLQIGLGRIPNEMLKYLTGRRDLGIHSDVITDGVVDLIETGVITGKAKGVHRGQVVTSYCMGTRRLYDFIDRNPLFSFQPISYVCNPSVIAAHDRFVSVTQAFAVDLTGQVCSDQFQGEFYGGVSTQPDFLRAAAASHGGKPIICLPSTTADGKISRIRPLLLEGEGATISRSDVHYVVTEYGSAYLFGKSIQERALTLVEIAHPSFRQWLLEEAKRLGYVRPDQGLRTKRAYPVEEEREAVLKDGRKVSIRPSRASDVRALQDLFYTMSREDVYTRFFQRLEALAVSEAEHLCNVDYENEMAFLAAIGERENEKVVGSSCYFLNPSTNLAEVAYMIRSDWQGTGLGTALQQRMTEYAKARGLRGFTAEILMSNDKMLRLARSVSDKVTMTGSDGVYEVTMLF